MRQVSGKIPPPLSLMDILLRVNLAHHHSRLRIIASLLAFGHLWHYCRYRWWTSNYPVSFELWNECA